MVTASASCQHQRPSHCLEADCTLQVFYAMCQGLLYAFCYHLDNLLSKDDSEDSANAQLQSVHISDAASASALHDSPTCMQPAAVRQTLSQLLPCILHHRCNTGGFHYHVKTISFTSYCSKRAAKRLHTFAPLGNSSLSGFVVKVVVLHGSVSAVCKQWSKLQPHIPC